MENYHISVIIVTYNAMKWVQRCFSSLENSSVPVNIIVVDNGSTDGTQDYIKIHLPDVEFVQSPENLGFGKANNLGIEMAYKNGADFFYLLNQDTWLYEDTIAELLTVYESNPDKNEIGILSPFHVDGTETKLDIFLDKYIALNFENRLISDLYMRSPKDYYEIKFINAAHWFMPRKTIEEVGGFNPYFFHYGEDNEYVNRIRYHKKKILLCTKSKAVHDGNQNLKKVDYTKFERLNLETKIMNPAYENGLKLELKSLKQSMIKNIFKGRTIFAKSNYNRYKKIKSEAEKLNKIRVEVSKKGSTFLNLP